jgi:hypothetical protein
MDWRRHRRISIAGWSVGRIGDAVLIAVLGATVLSLASGCDDKRDAVPIIPPTATTQAMPPATRPTTQELLLAPRKKITLGSFPLTLEVPPTWKLNATGNWVYLEGESPHGDVRIQLTPQGAPLKLDSVLAMDKRARSKAASQPATLLVSPLKPINPPAETVQKMEEREFIRDLPVVREGGKTELVDRVDWAIYVFVPEAGGYNLDVLNFSGLSLKQYEEDKEFLEHIIRSLHYDTTHGALD